VPEPQEEGEGDREPLPVPDAVEEPHAEAPPLREAPASGAEGDPEKEALREAEAQGAAVAEGCTEGELRGLPKRAAGEAVPAGENVKAPTPSTVPLAEPDELGVVEREEQPEAVKKGEGEVLRVAKPLREALPQGAARKAAAAAAQVGRRRGAAAARGGGRAAAAGRGR
jgi:hypothetical protein